MKASIDAFFRKSGIGDVMNTAIIAFIIGVIIGYIAGIYLPIPGIKP